MWFKKILLYSKYYFRNASNSIHWSKLLFLLSFFIFISILFPNINRRLPIFNNWEKIYDLKGKVIILKSEEKQNLYVEVGGHKVRVSDDGRFEISFPSKTPFKIPLIITLNDTSLIKRISFDNGLVNLDTIILFHEKHKPVTRN